MSCLCSQVRLQVKPAADCVKLWDARRLNCGCNLDQTTAERWRVTEMYFACTLVLLNVMRNWRASRLLPLTECLSSWSLTLSLLSVSRRDRFHNIRNISTICKSNLRLNHINDANDLRPSQANKLSGCRHGNRHVYLILHLWTLEPEDKLNKCSVSRSDRPPESEQMSNFRSHQLWLLISDADIWFLHWSWRELM